jgi:hypothetical protein
VSEAQPSLFEPQASKKKVKMLARWEGVKRPSRSKSERIEIKMGLCPSADLGSTKSVLVGSTEE